MTREDLDRMPDDGHRYELIDGVLVASPAPAPLHQRAAFRLAQLLDAACPDDLEVFMAPFDVALADDTVMQPDLLVVRRVDTTSRGLRTAPVLAVEVLSPYEAQITPADLGQRPSPSLSRRHCGARQGRSAPDPPRHERYENAEEDHEEHDLGPLREVHASPQLIIGTVS